ncbi:lysine-specific demethylase REF6-like [Helianthus annuus]|uniref:lysine-specific demethylase REF6-like n=1 Tax=Helianthus annuus TaxID=4232 RepID=UPI000B8FB755|nr:lysine-specific demethylase REF6-like [Helianthus annuus]
MGSDKDVNLVLIWLGMIAARYHVSRIVDKRAKGILNSSYDQPKKKGDPASLFSCVTCGCLCFSCVAIVQPSKTTAHYLMSNEDVNVIDQGLSSGKLLKSSSSTPEHKDIPAFTLLALAYGDSSDSEEGSEPTKLVLESKHSLIGLRPMDSSACEKDSSRLRVFCLDHAHELEQRLRAVGGVLQFFIYVKGKLLKSSSSTPEHKDIPAFTLLALAYGDSSDSEEGSEPTKLVLESKHSLIGLRPMDSSACEKDSSRLRVFCLDHAHELEQRLRAVGGVHMLLLCHQDYREINDAARIMGKELGTSYNMLTHVKYKSITEQEKTMIQWALDDEETATGNQDWAVKMGIDIFYSAKLGCSSSYKKQMPYNAVIYNAFRQDYPSDDQSGRQKKITVAGRWCGKVWISNQVHPLLLVRDDEHDAAAAADDDDDHNDNQQEDQQAAVHVFPKMNVNHENHLVVRTSTRKRNKAFKGMFLEVEASPPPLSSADSEDESDYDPSKSSRRITHKPARNLEVMSKQKSKMNQNQAKKGNKNTIT